MKKIILVCIGVVMLFSFASCNGGMPTGVSYENVGHGLIKVTAGSGSAPIVAWNAKQKTGVDSDGKDITGNKWCSTYLDTDMGFSISNYPKHSVVYLPISDLFAECKESAGTMQEHLHFHHPYGEVSEVVLGSAEGDGGLFEEPVEDVWDNPELVDFKLNSDCTKFEPSEIGKKKGLKVGSSFSIKTADYTKMNTKITSTKAEDPTVANGKVSYTVDVKKDGTDAPDYYAVVVPCSVLYPSDPYPFMDKSAYKLDGSGKFEAETSCSSKEDFQMKNMVFVFGCDDSDKKKAATEPRLVVPKITVDSTIQGKWTCLTVPNVTITLECGEDSIYFEATDSNSEPEWNIAKFDILAQNITKVENETSEDYKLKLDVEFIDEINKLNVGEYNFRIDGSDLKVTVPGFGEQTFTKSNT